VDNRINRGQSVILIDENGWYMSQAAMYNQAAAAQYARANYLKSR
jgi:hypothetical protein